MRAVLVAIGRLAAVCALLWAGGAAQGRRADDDFFQPFLGDLQAEIREAARDHKTGILLVYEQEGCPFCEWMHESVLGRSEVQRFYREHFLLYRIDIRGVTPLQGFDGRRTDERAFAAGNRVRGTPMSVFYGLDGRELTRFAGVPKDAAEYLELGKYVVQGAYERGPFARYKAGQADH